MNPSIARSHRTPARRRLLVAGAAVVAAAVLALAGCSGAGNVTESTPSSSESAPKLGNTGEVPDVTNLLLATAQSNLEFAGYKVTVVDASGAPVTAEDPTAWRITKQDPGSGPADPGSTVTITAVQLPAATPAATPAG